jgi:hypothetical protein
VKTLRPQVLIAVAALCAAGRVAQAQDLAPPEDGGPVVIGESTERWKPYELKTFSAFVDFNGRYRSDTLKQQGQADLTDTETRLRELLDLNGQMYFGHKNLVDLTASAQFGLEESTLDSETAQAKIDESQLTTLYNLSALILANSYMPTTVYTRRDEVTLDQAFSGSIDSLTSETGIVSTIRSVSAPTTLRVFHLENDQTSLLGTSDSSLTQDSASAQSNITLSDQHRLDLNWTFDQVSETQGSGFQNDYDRNDAQIAETFTFGGKGQHQLRSFLRFYDESGNFKYQTVRWDEQLQLIHSERLETRYNTTAEHLSRDDLDQTVARGDANIRHKLFDSLVSTGTVGGQQIKTSENFSTTDLFINGGLEYTKLVPYGRFDSSAGVSVNMQQNSERGGLLTIVDEPHTFNDPLPIVLSRRQIIPGSIVVTALGGFPTYIEGPDYTVSYFPDRAEVRILPGRGVVDGQTLLFDYVLGPEPGSNIDTLGTSITVRYTLTETALRGLSVYTTYRTQTNNLDTEDPTLFVLDDVRVLQYGADYRRGGLTLRAEQENRESTVNPYDTSKLQATYDYILGIGSVVTADASYDLIDYQMPVNHVEFIRLTTRWEQRLTGTLAMTLGLEYRDEKDDLSGNSNGLEERFGLKWKYRQTSAFLEVNNSSLEATTSEQTSQTLEFGFRRRF